MRRALSDFLATTVTSQVPCAIRTRQVLFYEARTNGARQCLPSRIVAGEALAKKSTEQDRGGLMNPLVEFVSIFLLGLVMGVSFSHLLQRGPKATLSGAQFLAVQQVLLRNYGPAIGGLEVAALLSTLAMAIFTWRKPVVPFLAILACGCVVLMVTIWAAWIHPINRLVNRSTGLSIRGRPSGFRRTGQTSATGGTFFARSGLSCPLLPSAQPSAEYLRKARASGRPYRTETSQTAA
jgi:hypothetical protein